MTKQKRRNKESKLRSYMKAPLRFLKKARDMYVKGMIRCSGRFPYAEASMGCPSTGHLCTLPFGVFSTTIERDSDFKELVRAASSRSSEFGGGGEGAATPRMKMPRSRSVGIGRIDEDKVCEFGDDGDNVTPGIFRRSRSHAVCYGGRAGLF